MTAAHHRRHVGHRSLAGRGRIHRRVMSVALRQRLGHQRDACRGTGADRATDQERATRFIMLFGHGSLLPKLLITIDRLRKKRRQVT